MRNILLSILLMLVASEVSAESIDITSSLSNPDFESCTYGSTYVSDCPGWTINYDVFPSTNRDLWPKKYGTWEKLSGGSYYMNIYGTSATAGLIFYQTISAPADGTYTLKVDACTTASTFYLYISDGTNTTKTRLTSTAGSYSASIESTKGNSLTIGIYTDKSTSSVWGYCDNFTLSYVPKSTSPVDAENIYIDGKTYNLSTDGKATLVSDYLRGGDISELDYVEDLGAKFYDANGTEKDALQIMKENGVNIVRLRLYNNPGTSVSISGTSYKVPAGYLDETDVLKLAKRAKALGMKIELTFHYSDYWTNGTTQFKPSDWSSLTLAKLETKIYDYTYAFLEKMNDQGTTPEYVSLGNEIQAGMLFGELNSDNNYTSTLTVNGQATSANASNLAAMLNQGSKAVRTACPDAKIILHFTLSTGVTVETYKWLLGTLGFGTKSSSNYVDFDIIGTSYYPYWNNELPSCVNTLANTMYSNYGKDLMIMETGYSWTQYKPSGRYGGNYEGQLSLNGTCYNEATESGQKSFMEAVQSVIKSNSHILGYLYWDPVMVEQKVNGSWINTNSMLHQYNGTWYGDGNVVGNTTWFDYDGKALPVLEAVAEDAEVPATITYNGATYTVTTGTTPDGDINLDGKVDIADVSALISILNNAWTGEHGTTDLNSDGKTDLNDINNLIELIK